VSRLDGWAVDGAPSTEEGVAQRAGTFAAKECRMKRIVSVCVIAAMVAAGAGAPAASAHRSGCHRHHVCPSDHATYKWKGKLCVKPTSDKRTSKFKQRMRHAGLTYYCK
jgi:hypothetical protein